MIRLSLELINHKVNFLFLPLIFGITFLGSAIDYKATDGVDYYDAILTSHVGPSVLLFAFLFIINVHRLFKNIIIANLIANGLKEEKLFFLFTIQCIFFCIVCSFFYFLTGVSFQIFFGVVEFGNTAAELIFKYFIGCLFYCELILLFYFVCKNSYLSMFLLVIFIFVDRVLKTYFFQNVTVSPLDFLYTFIKQSRNLVPLLLITAGLFGVNFFLIKKKKRWL